MTKLKTTIFHKLEVRINECLLKRERERRKEDAHYKTTHSCGLARASSNFKF